MPTSSSTVVTLDCGDPDSGFGVYSARILLDWDKDAPKLSDSAYCNLTAQGYGDSAPTVWTVEMKMTASVSGAGIFTTTRSPKNAGGQPVDHKTMTIKQDTVDSITRTIVLHVKVEDDDETPDFSRTLKGNAWLEFTVTDTTETNGEINDPEPAKSDDIGFGMGVYKA